MARYELCERIGLGGMAEIFRGVAVAGAGFEKPVAIKRILPHLSRDARFVELLIAEARLLSQLKHKNIVQIYDVGLGDDGRNFLVMEYVDGLDLRAFGEAMAVRNQSMPIEVSLYLAEGICDALEYAHRARDSSGLAIGLVHRDVSPSNVMLSRSGEVKLTDFGIAKPMNESATDRTLQGKFAYISPEQARTLPVDARSDLFSMGVILFELLLGRPLFSSLPDFEALRRVREVDIPRPSRVQPDFDRELETLVMTCLAAEPGARFQSAGELAQALRRYRYAHGSVVDPAALLARLVTDATRVRQETPHLFEVAPEISQEFTEEGTVVRISTAVGFLPSDEAGGDNSAFAEPEPSVANDFSEPTIAMAPDELATILGARTAADDARFSVADADASSARRKLALPQRSLVGGSQRPVVRQPPRVLRTPPNKNSFDALPPIATDQIHVLPRSPWGRLQTQVVRRRVSVALGGTALLVVVAWALLRW